MSIDERNYCIINGVPYNCRCCFDPGRRIYPLTDEANSEKTLRDLLKDVAQLKAEDDDLLPKTVCSKCMERLKSSHDFILQIHNVNKKYTQLLTGVDDPLQGGLLNDIENYNDCLAESAIALPLELPEVKLEEQLSFGMDISDTQMQQQDICRKSEVEDDDDPFTNTFDDDPKTPSDQLENESEITTGNGTTKLNLCKKSKEKEDGKTRRRKQLTKICRKSKLLTKNIKKIKIEKPDDEDIYIDDKVLKSEDGKTSNRKQLTKTCKKSLDNKIVKPDDKDNYNDDEFLELDKLENRCPICFKEYKNKSYVADHIKIVHEKLKPFQCSHCTKTFPTNTAKILHEITHTGNYPFVCEFCKKRFRLLCKLKVHKEIHTTKPELLCPICKRAQKTIKDLEEHVKNHDDNRLQCPSCGRLFRRAGQLNDHYNAVHLKLRPYKCAFCELGFGDRKTRRTHERIHRPKDPIPK